MWTMQVHLLSFLLVVSKIPARGEKSIYSRFGQSDFKLKFEWAAAISHNPNFVEEFRCDTFKYNRTCAAMNITLLSKVDVGSDLELIVQAYKLSSNEYRLFPMRFEVNFCKSVQYDLVGMSQMLNCGNYNTCNIKKRVRNTFCNFTPDQTRFPPYVPNGRYKIVIQAMYNNEEMFLLDTYGEIYRPFV